MPDTKISQLTGGGAVQATDQLPIARGSANFRVTGADIAAAATSVGTLTSLAVSGNGVLQTINGSASAFTDYRIGGVAQARVGTQNFATGDLSLTTVTAAPVVFGTNNTERMRLDASGNLGLGVTPSAWAIGRVMQIGSTSGPFYYGAGGQSIIGVNAYFDTSWKYAAVGHATYYQQSSGQHTWFNATSGANAGNPITFTQAMTLDASGNLLVGLTSTIGAAKAAVAGTILSSTNTLSTFSGAYGGFDWVSRSLRIFSGSTDATNSQIEFYAGVSGAISERFRIKGPGQVRFIPLAAAPTTNVEDGDVYFDSGTNKLRVRAGGAWVDLH